jgi:hypothetical protein
VPRLLRELAEHFDGREVLSARLLELGEVLPVSPQLPVVVLLRLKKVLGSLRVRLRCRLRLCWRVGASLHPSPSSLAHFHSLGVSMASMLRSDGTRSPDPVMLLPQ